MSSRRMAGLGKKELKHCCHIVRERRSIAAITWKNAVWSRAITQMSRRRQAAAACEVQSTVSRTYREAKVMATADGIFRRVDAFEYAWCLRLNRGCQRRR